MRVHIDECIPRKIKFDLSAHGHECRTVQESGLAGKRNGELISLAEGSFEVFVTLDKNLRYQQNLVGRRIAVLIIRARSNRVADIRPHLPASLAAITTIKSGQIIEISDASSDAPKS